ncbi:hypothetical protein B0H13DRAFT_1910863 [Mycena leptocephala]|nr:hypothetical protein B0H13DRAFT_1910863 [Mycena leptocephala]
MRWQRARELNGEKLKEEKVIGKGRDGMGKSSKREDAERRDWRAEAHGLVLQARDTLSTRVNVTGDMCGIRRSRGVGVSVGTGRHWRIKYGRGRGEGADYSQVCNRWRQSVPGSILQPPAHAPHKAFTQQQLLMELAAEHSDEESDDGELEGSGDGY